MWEWVDPDRRSDYAIESDSAIPFQGCSEHLSTVTVPFNFQGFSL
eukprot:gene10798-1963_t